MPTAPAAPGLLVMTTACLSTFSSAAASGRPLRSAWPPGGKGLTIVIGRVGNGSSAAAEPTSPASTITEAIASDRSILTPGSDKGANSTRNRSCYLGPIGYSGGGSESSANFAPARVLGQRQV